jgi:hypothetical protein
MAQSPSPQSSESKATITYRFEQSSTLAGGGTGPSGFGALTLRLLPGTNVRVETELGTAVFDSYGRREISDSMTVRFNHRDVLANVTLGSGLLTPGHSGSVRTQLMILVPGHAPIACDDLQQRSSGSEAGGDFSGDVYCKSRAMLKLHYEGRVGKDGTTRNVGLTFTDGTYPPATTNYSFEEGTQATSIPFPMSLIFLQRLTQAALTTH